MPVFEDLIKIKGVKEKKVTRVKVLTNGDRPRKTKERGCDVCPSKENWKYGIQPVKGKVRGKKIFVWAMCPGPNENKQGKELIGKAGQLLWDTFEGVGITRDMCDIQNTVRCYTADVVDRGEYFRMRNPSKEELRCCSIYNEKALAKSKARVHVIFGEVAQKQLLGPEYRKDKKVFYSDVLKAWVICATHPSYFGRSGGPIGAKYEEWRKLLAQVSKLAKQNGGRYGYLEKQDYQAVVTAAQARKAYREIKTALKKDPTGRLSLDFEEGLVKNGKPTHDGSGDRTPLVLGFSPRPGMSRVFWLDHPDLPQPRTKKDARVVKKIASRLCASDIPKIFHKGNYDVEALEDLLGWYVENYDYDTEFGEYFTASNAYAYGLLSIANRRFQQMAGYKEIVVPEALRKDYEQKLPAKAQKAIKEGRQVDWSPIYKQARNNHGLNLALLSWKTMLLYNGGDADIQKRIELTTYKKVKMPLMHVYIDAGFVLSRMERYDSPLFDYKHHKLLSKLFPIRRDRTLRKLRKIVKKVLHTRKPAKVIMLRPKKKEYSILTKDSWKTFNPGSHPQVKDLLYNWLRLPIIGTKDNTNPRTGEVKPTTDKAMMALLADYHPAPKLIDNYRHDSKACSTYLDGFLACAKANGGRLRTKWWLTGASTGRMSSGGGGKRKAEDEIQDVVNLQNIHGDPQLQNLVVSTRKWRKLQKYWERYGPFKTDKDIPKWAWKLLIFLGFDQAQMELRVLAQKSGDKVLIRIFNRKPPARTEKSKECPSCKKHEPICVECHNCDDCCPCTDPHALVGHELTGWSVVEIKHNEKTRRLCKNMQFGIVFGLNENNLFDYLVVMGVYKYSDGSKKGNREEKKNREEVKKYYRKYFQKFKGVAVMIQRDRELAEDRGWCETLFGFRRDLTSIQTHGSPQNIAINQPIQGSANQLMLFGVATLNRARKVYELLQHPQIDVHDALYFVTQLKDIWDAANKGQELLQDEPVRIAREEFGIDWKVKLVAEPKAGFRFGVIIKDIHKIKGENRTAQLLNMWCQQNKENMAALQKDMRAVA